MIIDLQEATNKVKLKINTGEPNIMANRAQRRPDQTNNGITDVVSEYLI